MRWIQAHAVIHTNTAHITDINIKHGGWDCIPSVALNDAIYC